MSTSKQDGVSRLQLLGWVFFAVGCLFFIAQSVADQNPLALTGSIGFLLGCMAFLIPLSLRKLKLR